MPSAGRISPFAPPLRERRCACSCAPLLYDFWEELDRLKPYRRDSDIWLRVLSEEETPSLAGRRRAARYEAGDVLPRTRPRARANRRHHPPAVGPPIGTVGYSSQKNRTHLRRRGSRHTISNTAPERQVCMAARSDLLRRTQNSLPSGSARITQPEPSGFR